MKLILGMTGASGAYAARLFLKRSPVPVALVASEWGKKVYNRECGPFDSLAAIADKVYDNDDLAAAISSGSVPTAGMVILPCSINTAAKIAHGISDSLITRAAHCHLKEQRKLVLCVREAPWSLMDIENMHRLAMAGAIIMPLSPPFYIADKRDPHAVTMADLLAAFVDRVLALLLGQPVDSSWEKLL